MCDKISVSPLFPFSSVPTLHPPTNRRVFFRTLFRSPELFPATVYTISGGTTFTEETASLDMADLCCDYGFDMGLTSMQPKSVGIIVDQDCEGDRSTSWSTGQSGTCNLDQWKSTIDESSPCSMSLERRAPICRQFWKAGVYNDDFASVSKSHVGSSYLHIHPKFLHSNATSHKWAFGAIAELLDNAVDEETFVFKIRNGAKFVMIDKISNPRNGSPALLIQDDGAGMDPEAMRKCLSFGFSEKKSESSIGKYGNGFKTSSMRLGADAIVFTRTFVDQTLTQSIGLLSYTFLTQSGYDRIVVPMVHYKYNFVTGSFESLQPTSEGRSNLNTSVLLQWSPYSSEEELLKQFDDVGFHGTKIIIYNLWLDDDGNMELDFESDPEDIRLAWDGKTKAKDDSNKAITENHIANRLQYSLRAYLSILYLKLPQNFCIVLRGKVVLYHNIATDLKHPQFILYKPNSGGSNEGSVITTIGFLKEAPRVKVHGFNIYHKSRLILPFLPVVALSNSKGRGVVGVLEADYIEPTHSKQDFEKTNVFQKLVTRLRLMTLEYWDFHCGYLGYTIPKRALPSYASHGFPKEVSNSKRKSPDQPNVTPPENVTMMKDVIPPENVTMMKRKSPDQPDVIPPENVTMITGGADMDQKKAFLMQENKKLRQQCLEFDSSEKELELKVVNLKTVLKEAQKEYAALRTEVQLLEKVEVGKQTKIEIVDV